MKILKLFLSSALALFLVLWLFYHTAYTTPSRAWIPHHSEEVPSMTAIPASLNKTLCLLYMSIVVSQNRNCKTWQHCCTAENNRTWSATGNFSALWPVRTGVAPAAWLVCNPPHMSSQRKGHLSNHQS